MDSRRFWIFFVVIVVFLDVVYSQGTACASGSFAGLADVTTKTNSLDGGTGNTILLSGQDFEYKFTCCGFISGWEYYGKTNTGDVYFQVWRDIGTNPATLAGENQHTHTGADGAYNVTISAANRIQVKDGDYIGLHFPGNTFISYHNGHQVQLSNSYTASAATFDWSAVATSNNRDYAVKAYLEPSGAAPTINLPAAVTVGDVTPIGTLVFTVVVTDPDVNDVVTTSHTLNGGAGSYFAFNPANFEIRTIAALAAGTYTISFTASDLCAQTASGDLTITVTNIPPTIHNLPEVVSLSEDQATQLLLISVNVTDPGDTVTCIISSAIPNSTPFSLNTDKGIYVNNNPGLAYLTIAQYVLTITCTDTKDPVSSTFTINLIQNMPPTIHNLPATTNLHEDHILEQLLYTLNVTDPESQTISCSVTAPASSPFFIKPISGTSDLGIFVQFGPGFVHATTSQYDLTISCQDSRNTVTGSYTVTITPNQPPQFTNLDAVTSISRLTTGIGDQVFRVTSYDNETDQIYYNMTNNPTSCPFAIYSSGDIVTTSSLYTTSLTTCTLTIWVYDGKTLVGSKTLTISITGINNAPTFTNLPLATAIVLPENSAKGLSVYQINVTDIDTADTHTFTSSYNPIEGAKYFVVDPTTGLVSTSSQNNINFEGLTATYFQITIYVSDSYEFISETLNITINNVNEAPYFDKSYYAISGDEDLTTPVIKNPGFVVTDHDTVDTVSYSMNCGTQQAYFTMDPTTGNVTLGAGYDLDTGTNPSTVSCAVVVTDGEFNGTATLLITINQINDNTPQFSTPTYTFYVSSDEGIGASIGSISATDGDISTHIYGTVTYSMTGLSTSCDCFSISDIGGIYVTQSLLSYANGSSFTFTGTATDGGNLQATTTITIIIPETTTATTTTTTDRYLTFLEDPRNSVWLVLIGCALVAFLLLMVYFAYTLGWLDNFCRECTNRLRELCKPRPRKPAKRPPQRFRTPEPERYPTPTPEPIPYDGKQWEAWRTQDFMINDFS